MFLKCYFKQDLELTNFLKHVSSQNLEINVNALAFLFRNPLWKSAINKNWHKLHLKKNVLEYVKNYIHKYYKSFSYTEQKSHQANVRWNSF